MVSGEPDYVYAKVKLSQGLWWAATKRPNYWFIENLKVGEKEKDLTGKPIAELLSFSYYPYYPSRLIDGSLVNPETLYDIYLDVKISTEKAKKAITIRFPIQCSLLKILTSSTEDIK